VTSANATVTVNLLPVEIFAAPLPATVAAGSSAAFVVLAPGSQPVTFQWRRNGVAIAGATAPSYFTPATTMADDGALYSVVATNPVNSVTSAAVRLTVTGVAVAPAMATAPASVSLSEGQTATFTATATGSAPLAYQWLRNGTAISGATSASHTTAATTTADNAARYAVRVSNLAGNVTSAEAVLTVQAATGGLVGRAWSAGQLLESNDNEVLDQTSVIDDSGRVTTMFLKWNGTRWQLFATRGAPGAAGAAPSWTTPLGIDVLAGQAVFADDKSRYWFDLAGSPNGNAVAVWTLSAPCTSTSYRTVAGTTCLYAYTARYLASSGNWEAPVNSGSFPERPRYLTINDRGDIAFATTGGVPTAIAPYYASKTAVAWRPGTAAGFTTQLLEGPIATFEFGMDNAGNMLVAAALTQNATTDAAAFRGTLAAGFGTATVLDTRGAAVSQVSVAVGQTGQQMVAWYQNNGTRTSVYAATSAKATDALVVQDLGITNWNWVSALDNGQLLLVDYSNLKRYRWSAGTWGAAETVPAWQGGFASTCVLARNGDGLCVNFDGGGWSSYDVTRNVTVQSRVSTSLPNPGYTMGLYVPVIFGPPVLSPNGVGFNTSVNRFDVLPTPEAAAGDGRNVVNLWGFYLK
jgi:Immunoglobulin I-set domain